MAKKGRSAGEGTVRTHKSGLKEVRLLVPEELRRRWAAGGISVSMAGSKLRLSPGVRRAGGSSSKARTPSMPGSSPWGST